MVTPKYTFLLPAYKPQFFEEALLSIKNQTYTNFKVIVSDDCSPYDLKSIYDKVCATDSRFSFRRNKENMGSKSLVSHWNLLVDLCDTEFLIMASDDDVYLSCFLEDADLMLERYPNVNLFCGRTRCIDIEGNYHVEERVTSEWMDHLHFIYRIYKNDWVGGVARFVYKTRILKQQGAFVDFPSAWFSDDVTNFLMSENGCCFSERIIFHLRYSSVNISGQWGDSNAAKNKVAAAYACLIWTESYMKRFSLHENQELVKKICRKYRMKIYNNIQNYIYHCTFIVFFRFLYYYPKTFTNSRVRMAAHYLYNKIKQSTGRI